MDWFMEYKSTLSYPNNNKHKYTCSQISLPPVATHASRFHHMYYMLLDNTAPYPFIEFDSRKGYVKDGVKYS